MTPPLALDIDGTLTTPDGVVDSRVFDVLPAWDAPVVLATGKAFPYPIALCHFVGIPETVVAENGGVVCVDDVIRFAGDRARAERVIETFEARGGDAGWGDADLANRWRETELIASTAADETLLREVAAEFEMAVVDTGYAYHVKTPGVEKGDGLELVAEELGVDPETFVAVGDSENDASTFAVAGQSFAVANADPVARDAADVVLDAGYMDGTLAALESVRA
jgi:phosphoglycolate phosphatase (TIGR01487 family)